jgi:quercetin dioxygenase-like cupin family protein
MKIKSVFLLIPLFLSAIIFQNSVPVANEGHHHLKFENKYVRVFDVVVDSGDETLYHIHSNDYVFVSLGDATLKAQVQGDQQTDLILKDGEARYTKAPITHRVVNIGKTPFHAVAIEILASPGIKEEAAPLKGVPGHSIVLENERVRIERLILEPGQSTGMHTHTLMSLGVAVTASKVAYDSPGQPQQIGEFQPGVFNWHGEKRTHSLKNIGTTRFEAIEIEWK